MNNNGKLNAARLASMQNVVRPKPKNENAAHIDSSRNFTKNAIDAQPIRNFMPAAPMPRTVRPEKNNGRPVEDGGYRNNGTMRYVKSRAVNHRGQVI